MLNALVAATAALFLLTAPALAAKANPAALEKAYLDLNEQCRGGSGDDPDTIKACDQREQVSARLRELNICFAGDRFRRCRK